MPYKDPEVRKQAALRSYYRRKNENPIKLLDQKRAATRRMRLKNPDAFRQMLRERYSKYKHVHERARKKYYSRNRDKILESSKLYYESHKEQKRLNQKKWRSQNMDIIRLKAREKMATNPQYRIANNLRCRMNDALRAHGLKRDKHIEELIGCTVEFLMGYLEAKFTDGMSWENRGKWHIDHIMPCASFDLTKPEQRAICFHYSNLQPLWAIDNIVKSDNVPKTN